MSAGEVSSSGPRGPEQAQDKDRRPIPAAPTVRKVATARVRASSPAIPAARTSPDDEQRPGTQPSTSPSRKGIPQPDLSLLQGNDQKAEQAWNTWVSSMRVYLMAVALKRGTPFEVAEDIIQNGWAYMKKRIYTLTDVNLNAYVSMVVTNGVVDYFRARNSRKEIELSDGVVRTTPHRVATPESIVLQEFQNNALNELFGQLPQKMHAALGYLVDGLSIRDVAKMTGFSTSEVDSLRKNLARILRSEDSIAGMKEFVAERGEEQWLRTLTREGITLGRILTSLRFFTGDSVNGFSSKIGLSRHEIRRITTGEINKVEVETMERIIENFGFDVYPKVVQLLRLYAYGQQPMSREALRTGSLGELIYNLRIQTGMKRAEIGKEIGFSPGRMGAIERTAESLSVDGAVTNLIQALDINPDGALSKIIWQKQNYPQQPISPDLLQQVLMEHFIFGEHLDGVPDYPLTDNEGDTMTELNNKRTFGKKMRFLREQNGFPTVKALSEAVNRSTRTLSRIENDHTLPSLETLASVGTIFGYDVHHPIMWMLIDDVSQFDQE